MTTLFQKSLMSPVRYNFSKQVKRDAYTIEEAEAIMKGNRRMQQEIQNKWLQKMGLKVEGETGGEKAGGGSKRGRRSGKGGEIDDDEDRPRMKGGKGGDDDEDDAAAKEESEGDDDAGEKGAILPFSTNFLPLIIIV